MYYCLVCYPKIDTTNLEVFRRKYDPAFEHIRAHMTFVFPINGNKIEKGVLTKHLGKVTGQFPGFEISLEGFEKSWDHYLFLSVKNGKENFTKLHDILYSGSLEPFFRKDLPFSPHLTIGRFIKKDTEDKTSDPQPVVFDELSYNKARAEADKSNLKYTTKIDCLTLITLSDDFSKILDSENFNLSTKGE